MNDLSTPSSPQFWQTMPQLEAPVHYRIDANDVHGHHFDVCMSIANPAAEQIVSLPAWIPGSYLIREFARHLSALEAQQSGEPVTVVQTRKNTWHISCCATQALVLRYRVYAFDTSVRTAWLDAQRGFFNPTSLCLRAHGQESSFHAITLLQPLHAPQWQLATALQAVTTNANGFGDYIAQNYDELADSPVELGCFWSGHFDACGITHQFVVAGASAAFDGERLLCDAQRICEAAIAFWHPDAKKHAQGIAPHGHYTFLLNAVANGYGGLEHRSSTALICNRSDLPRLGDGDKNEGYRTLLGLISHEYFHTWNVKRMRPSEFERYNYEQENYTELLWFFEGFTSYYDDLLLRRAGLLSDAQYWTVLAKTIQQVAQTPGRHVQSVAQASFDAWMKYYRQDENTANITVSYYTKGALIALCLDLYLRQQGVGTLDQVMRTLWDQSQGGPIREQDIAAALQTVTGSDHAFAKLSPWVHGVGDLPLAEALACVGLRLGFKTATWPQRLGILVQENAAGMTVRRVQTASAAERAGLAVGDECIGVEVAPAVTAAQGQASAHAKAWRIKKWEEFDGLVPDAHRTAFDVRLLVARDGQLIWLQLQVPAPDAIHGEAYLEALDAGKAAWLDWLDGTLSGDDAAKAINAG
ncbi:M61 family metallopeptidase [Lampropedia puyangensis]|uniref:M61 family metallopeptidase n=1 Tax=Lampropedia puyangensis TaxID=1330072 RepID=A0A4S8EZ75_9BURK|nr:M61 family metallopeptidase [Lampropedia puyangensis]THT99610.1 M61 family metallopeptidase [Lampropedia puyangensis]